MKYTNGALTWTIWENEEPTLMDFELYRQIINTIRFYNKVLPDRLHASELVQFLNEVLKVQKEHFPKEIAIYDTLL